MNKKLFKDTASTFNKFLNQTSYEAFFVNSNTILLNSTKEDLKTLKTRKMLQFYKRNLNNTYDPTGFPIEQKQNSGTSFSPSGQKSCVIIRHKEVDYIEIFSNNALKEIFSFPDLHGQIYRNPPLGGVSWSKSEDKILYIAEAKTEKEKTFSDLLTESADSADSQRTSSECPIKSKRGTEKTNPKDLPTTNKFSYGETNLFEESWGEHFTNVKRPQVYALDLKSAKSKLVKSLPPGFVFGEPLFLNNEESGLVVGYEAKGPLFGIYAYNTRPSKIFRIDLSDSEKHKVKDSKSEGKREKNYQKESETVLSEEEDHSAYNIRLSPCGGFVLYFSTRKEDKVHLASERVKLLDLATGENRVLVDIETNPGSEDGEFPGVYSYSQPERVWGSSSDFVALNSFFHSKKVVLIVDTSPLVSESEKPKSALSSRFKRLIDTNRERVFVLPLPGGFENCSAHLSGVFEDRLLCKLSSPSQAPAVWCCDLKNDCSWTKVSPDSTETVGVKMRHFIVQKEFKSNKEKIMRSGFEYIFIHPEQCKESPEKFPIILFLHGGPHSVFTNEYSSTVAFLCSMGFAVCAVNYRGSLGFGDAFLKANLGKKNELEDVMGALDDAKERFKTITDPMNFGLLGGSHGGFLTCMLSGLFPERFGAAVAINPVTNIPVLSATSDIPDWSFIESGLEFKDSLIPTPEEYRTMLMHSPVSLAEKVKTPTLMVLGAKDMRVPYLQNKIYTNILLKNSVKSKVLLYPGSGHSVSESIETKSDCLINAALWFIEHLKAKKQ